MSIDAKTSEELADLLADNSDWNFLVSQKLFCTTYSSPGRIKVDDVKSLLETSMSDTLADTLADWFINEPDDSTAESLVNAAISNLACIVAFDRLANKLSQIQYFPTKNAGNTLTFKYCDIDIDNIFPVDFYDYVARIGFERGHGIVKQNSYAYYDINLKPFDNSAGKTCLDREYQIKFFINKKLIFSHVGLIKDLRVEHFVVGIKTYVD